MKISKVDQQDYASLVVIWETSVRATHKFLSEEDIQHFKPLLSSQWLPQVTLRCVKDEQSQIIGFTGVAQGKIEMLFLSPQCRGKGIGKKLALYAVHELGATLVDVNEQNPQAVGFYSHLGFKRIGRSPFDGTGRPFPLLHMKWEPS